MNNDYWLMMEVASLRLLQF